MSPISLMSSLTKAKSAVCIKDKRACSFSDLLNLGANDLTPLRKPILQKHPLNHR